MVWSPLSERRNTRIRRLSTSVNAATGIDIRCCAFLAFLVTNTATACAWAWSGDPCAITRIGRPTPCVPSIVKSSKSSAGTISRCMSPTLESNRQVTGRVASRGLHVANPTNGEVEISATTSFPSSSVSVSVAEVDVRHGIRTSLIYDESVGRYVTKTGESLSDEDGATSNTSVSKSASTNAYESIRRMLTSSFLPEGVTPSYYSFMRWRIVQRFINANVHVFGTQSLLLGLGIKNRNSLGLGAALTFVLKDALGKIVRMLWASRMGRKFDPDAKRWRFRSAFVFAAGNGLEVATYVFPQFFLLFATVANCCKQVSMLTSSATRNALYNSFRDGKRENIGDITAKGEAQIAVVDLLGIASGVSLSRAVGVSVKSVLSVWILLQAVEIFCMYHEIRSVVFRMLNFERLYHVVDEFVSSSADFGLELATIPTPEEMAQTEKIFLPPAHLARRAIAFGSLGRAKLSPEELSELMQIFRKEKFILVVGENQKSRRRWYRLLGRRLRRGRSRKNLRKARLDAQEHCHIVLHADATNADIVKSTLALAFLRKKLADSVSLDEDGFVVPSPATLGDCMGIIRDARNEADVAFPQFLKVLSAAGWAPPARYMFGRVTMRAEWPIQGRPEKRDAETDRTITLLRPA